MGITTMKMMSSTSTTSTSGVTLISLLRALPPPTFMPMGRLPVLPRAALGGRHALLVGLQADAREARLVDHPHHLAHFRVLEPAVGLDDDVLVGRALVDVLERRQQLVGRDPLVAEEDAAVLLDGDAELLG